MTACTRNEMAVWVILEIFWTVSPKAHDWSSQILTERNLFWKIVKYRILSEVCMVNGTVSPQMWCIESMKGWYTPPDLLARIGKVNLSNAKEFGLICFQRICFRGPIYCDQEPLWFLKRLALECDIEDDCYFLGVHIRLPTRCNMFHSKIT